MKQSNIEIKYKLITTIKKENGGLVVTGPMSPVISASQIAKKFDIQVCGVVRIQQKSYDHFSPNIHNYKNELGASLDILMAVMSHPKQGFVAILFVDNGSKAQKIATIVRYDIYGITESYKRALYGKHLTFDHVKYLQKELDTRINLQILKQMEDAENTI